MKTKVELTIKPFKTPNYIFIDEPVDDQSRSLHLSEVDATTLYKLCSQFTKEVFKKAGKNMPDSQEK